MPDPVNPLLGGSTVAHFLRKHWQKEALLVRDAMPGFTGLFDRAALLNLAMRDDVQSRLVVRDGARWSLSHGPFTRAAFGSLPAQGWTLLVQSVNLHADAADALLRCFAFLPFARLDDLMVSYAVPGGGVGPHFDSYDVFLLQGFGRRRWRYGRQADLSLRSGLPLKILRRFDPKQDRVLASGDMLYLPPHYAHDGTAIDECTTYSIGFRAPSAQELAVAFIDFLRDDLALEGRYVDAGITPTRAPARIDAQMRRASAALLSGIRWDDGTVARFLGRFLTEPKAEVVFERPRVPLSHAAFARRIAKRGLRLDRRTQLLYDERQLYVNGDEVKLSSGSGRALRRLADDRHLSARACTAAPSDTLTTLYGWYRDGFVIPGD